MDVPKPKSPRLVLPLCGVPVPEGPLAVVAEPTPAWIAVPSLLIVTALVLIVASYRIRRMEVQYGSD
ncbi:MAG: hypothetical protein ACRD9S_02980 [Pyrinomonadaceae bacterium]